MSNGWARTQRACERVRADDTWENILNINMLFEFRLFFTANVASQKPIFASLFSSCTFTVKKKVKLLILVNESSPTTGRGEGERSEGRGGKERGAKGREDTFLSPENITANIFSIRWIRESETFAGLVTASLCLHGNSSWRSRRAWPDLRADTGSIWSIHRFTWLNECFVVLVYFVFFFTFAAKSSRKLWNTDETTPPKL